MSGKRGGGSGDPRVRADRAQQRSEGWDGSEESPGTDRGPFALDDGPEDPNELNSGRIPDPLPAHTPLYRWLAGRLAAAERTLRARGGVGLRMGIRVFWAFIAAVGVFLLFGPIINKPIGFDELIDSADIKKVDWIAHDAKIDARIDRAEDGSFVFRVTERMRARFANGPETSVERILPTQFAGNDLGLRVDGAEIDGTPAEVTRTDGPTRATIRLRTGGADPGAELTGDHEFSLSYTLRHLTTPETDESTGRPVDLFQWDLLAPAWEQGLRGLDVSVSLPTDLNERLVRKPHAQLSWSLVMGDARLSPEPDAPNGRVTYAFANDNSWPPHSNIFLDLVFPRGTFAQPPHTPLFWVQTFGPLVPLVLLALLLPFALAARAVSWGDAAGRPLFVAQSAPPKDVSPQLAARILRRSSARGLAMRLAVLRGRTGERRDAAIREIARSAQRTGRIGAAPFARIAALSGPETQRALDEGLIRVPRGYVRDAFIAAPLALAALQIGLIRQLNEQVVLAVVWWPAVFALLSLAIGGIVLAIALNTKPLTRDGALLKQYLRGIGAYVERTRFVERGTLDEPLRPYAVLLVPPRRAGRATLDLAVQELGDRDAAKGWRSSGVLRVPALVGAVLAALLLAGAIVVANALPTPYPQNGDASVAFGSDSPSETLRTEFLGFEADATLTRAADGRAELVVTERVRVDFEQNAARVPQIVRDWPAERFGQSLGLRVESVRIDGKPVEFRTEDVRDRRVMTTRLADDLPGEHEAEIRYVLATPFVAAERDGRPVQQLRWEALDRGWKFDSNWGGGDRFAGVRVSLSVAPDLERSFARAGWLARSPGDDALAPDLALSAWKPEAGESAAALRFATRTSLDDNGSWTGEPTSSGGAGAGVELAPGTVPGIDAGRFDAWVSERELSNRLVSGAALLLALVAAATGIVARMRGAAGASAALTAYCSIPVAFVALFVGFVWATADMPGDDPRFATMGIPVLIAFAAVVGGAILVARARAPRRPANRGAAGHAARGRGRGAE